MRYGGIKDQLAATIDIGAPNVPGQLLRNIFGNPNQRKILYRALDPEQAKNFRWLETTLRRTAAGRKEGSPTIPYAEALAEVRGAPGVIKDLFLKPMDSIQKMGDTSLAESNLKRLSNVLLNPEHKIKIIPSTHEF